MRNIKNFDFFKLNMFFSPALKATRIALYLLTRFQKSSHEKYSSCWNCKKKHFQTFLICGSCNYLQDPDQSIYKLSYFQLFEM